MIRHGLTVAAVALAALVAGCTPDEPAPVVKTSAPSPSPTDTRSPAEDRLVAAWADWLVVPEDEAALDVEAFERDGDADILCGALVDAAGSDDSGFMEAEALALVVESFYDDDPMYLPVMVGVVDVYCPELSDEMAGAVRIVERG